MPSHVDNANSGRYDCDCDCIECFPSLPWILAIFPTGLFGAHHYYLNRCGFGLLYTFTLRIFGVGYIVDWFRLPYLYERYKMGNRSKKHLDDAYLLWFPLGLLGFHHFYLQRPVWGLLYMLTLGFLGIGWLIDLFRMRTLVRNCNSGTVEPTRIEVATSNFKYFALK